MAQVSLTQVRRYAAWRQNAKCLSVWPFRFVKVSSSLRDCRDEVAVSTTIDVHRTMSSSLARVYAILLMAIRRLSVAALVIFVCSVRSASAKRLRCLKRSCSSFVA